MIKLGIIFILVISSQSSQLGDQVSLAVTIYNDDFAMVKDVREINFTTGNSFLYFTDVSSNIQTETVTFKAISDPSAIRVYEQNYEANLINTQSILHKYIDKEIQIYAKLGETSTKVNGTLLGYNNGYILKTIYGIQVLNNVQGITFLSLPEGFFTLPTLNWKVYSSKDLLTDCEVAYRTTGFSWKADYSITLNGNETEADFGGWVTIDNNSGKKYENATLKLIAGEVNTVSNINYSPRPVMMMTKAMASPTNTGSAPPSFSQKSFSDYHLYTLSQPVTLNESSKKQVEFVAKVYDIEIRKYNEIQISFNGYSQTNLKAANKIEFNNTQDNQLGIPLPKGTIRVFKTDDSDGSLEFVGEDSIDHTPKEENITITTGNAFDIVANKYASNYQSFQNSGYTADSNITITNHKDISAEIVVKFNNYYGDGLKIDWKTSTVSL